MSVTHPDAPTSTTPKVKKSTKSTKDVQGEQDGGKVEEKKKKTKRTPEEKEARKAKKVKKMEHDEVTESEPKTTEKKKEKKQKSKTTTEQDTNVATQDAGLNEEFYKKHNIHTTHPDYGTLQHFEKLPQPLAQLTSHKVPTPIQAATITPLLQNRDTIGIAETGSGKTLAFALPTINNILLHNITNSKGGNSHAQILVLAPTRELAMQTFNVYDECSKRLPKSYSAMNSICIYGGMPRHQQQKELKRLQPKIIVATPGRLIDFINDDTIGLQNVRCVVLDEADRMLDVGFEQDIRRILEKTPNERLTVMFSATWPHSVQKLAREFLKDPVTITIGSAELSTSSSVTQHVHVLTREQKESKLLQLMKAHHANNNRIIIFVLYKKEVPYLERVLQRNGYNVGSLSGDKNQTDRSASLEGFKNGSVPILIATDVAGRGLDIPDVEFVINYTFPLTIGKLPSCVLPSAVRH